MPGNPGNPANPANSMRFDVEIDGMPLGSFSTLEGISAEYEVTTHAEGGQNGFVHKLPGRLSFGTVRVSRGLDRSSPGLAVWFQRLARSGTLGRSTGRVVAMDDNNAPVAIWNFEGVWPVKYTGPSFDAATGAVAMETFEFAHNGFVD